MTLLLLKMDQRSQNDHLRVNKSGKSIRKSIFHQLNGNANAIFQPQPQQTHVYIINKNDFKSVVQQLTSYQSCESLPQNIPKRQKIRPEAINQTAIPPNAMAIQEDPDVSLYMRYLQSLLEDSSGSNEDQFQQLPHEAHSQPQVVDQTVPYSNGLEPVMTTTSPSPWFFDDSHQEMHGAYSLDSTGTQYPPQLQTPNFTFSSMTQNEVFGPDLGHP